MHLMAHTKYPVPWTAIFYSRPEKIYSLYFYEEDFFNFVQSVFCDIIYGTSEQLIEVVEKVIVILKYEH